MKRRFIAFMMVFAVVVFCSSASASADDHVVRGRRTFRLPAAVVEIEDGAFENTAVKTVILPDGLVRIGAGAFSDSINLKNVFIPASTRFIGEDAFPQNRGLKIFGAAGSYAKEWAREHQIWFIPVLDWTLVIEISIDIETQETADGRFGPSLESMEHGRVDKATADEGKSLRPQDRPELDPIDYRFP